MAPAVSVSLLDFLRTGVFGAVRWGLSRAELEALLGTPDGTANRSRRDRHPTVFVYGDFEFYIAPQDDLLYAVHCDNFSVPRGNAMLAVEPWILRYGLPLVEAEAGLMAEGIAFRKSDAADAVRLYAESGASLTFSTDDAARGLVAVSRWNDAVLSAHEPERNVSLTLTDREIAALRQEAARRGVSLARLCADWIRERLN